MQSLGLNIQGFTTSRIDFLRNYEEDSVNTPLDVSSLLNSTLHTMNKNYSISDDELSIVLALTESTKKTDNLMCSLDEMHNIQFHNKFYLKSFTIAPEVLRQLAYRWSESGLFPTVTGLWYDYLREFPGKLFTTDM
jgi:hypothetical protein